MIKKFVEKAMTSCHKFLSKQHSQFHVMKQRCIIRHMRSECLSYDIFYLHAETFPRKIS